MKLIIHAGMHKTGTSSIQAALAGTDLGRVCVAPWRAANHSALFALLFHEPVETYHSFRNDNVSRAELLDLRAHWQARLDACLASSEHDTLILSAEAISGHFDEAVVRMRDYFAAKCSDIRVIMYVRPPRGFIHSAFQQRLQGQGATNLDLSRYWPNYRRRFDKIDRVFGRDRVELVKYDRANLRAGDVVTDFFARAGLPAPAADLPVQNESLSLESIALLYAQRKFGTGFAQGYKGANKHNARLVEALKGAGQGRLAFSEDLLGPALERHADDLAWMENRLGETLSEPVGAGARAVGSDADLMEIATEALPRLRGILDATLDRRGPRQEGRLVRTLEALNGALAPDPRR